VGKAENPLKANAILNTQQVDLMFLDVDMPKMSGMEFLRSIPSLPLAIMTTAYTEYAIQGFELDVLDYLVKPISFERFLKACNKAREYFAASSASATSATGTTAPADFFFVKCDGKIEKVFHEELIYVEAMLNYVVLHTETRKLIVHHTIKGIAEQLPGQHFLKIHKSTIINISKVKSIEGNEINLGKSKVIISQNLQESVIKEIIQDRMLKR
jgi:DNA-binding LytR/AlgR family response regulator